MRLAALLLATLGHVVAGQMIDVQPGAKVRITAPGVVAGRIEGLITSRSGDSLVLLTSTPMQYRIALGSISVLSVSQGKSRLIGAAKGSVWGGGIMLLLSAAMSGDPDMRRGEYANSPPIAVPAFIAVETISGAMMGAGIGAIVGSQRWSSYELPSRVTVGVGKSRAGVSFAF